MLTLEELKILGSEVLAGEADTARISEIVSAIVENYSYALADLEIANGKITELATQNENLKETNMQLYLKVGTPVTEENPIVEEEEETLSYDDLIENGELV